MQEIGAGPARKPDGNVRVLLAVESRGNASLAFLDVEGNVTARYPSRP